MTNRAQILQWINQQQRGKSGIYPYHVAQDVAIQFRISIEEAQELVAEHIKQVLAESEDK